MRKKGNKGSQNKKICNLQKSIDMLRTKLYWLVAENFNHTEGLTITEDIEKVSRELDQLIIRYLQNQAECTEESNKPSSLSSEKELSKL